MSRRKRRTKKTKKKKKEKENYTCRVFLGMSEQTT
jgi:hypothetical protein